MLFALFFVLTVGVDIAAIGGTPRLSPTRKEEAKQGWDWHNELYVLSSELRQKLEGGQSEKERMALLKDLRRVMEKR